MAFFISLIFLTSKNVVLIYISSHNFNRWYKRLSTVRKLSIAPCKGIQDSLGFCIVCLGFGIPGTGFQSLSVEFGFWIPVSSGPGFRIPWALYRIPKPRIPDSTGNIFPGFCIPREKFSCSLESGFSYMGRFQHKNRCFWHLCGTLLSFITSHLY